MTSEERSGHFCSTKDMEFTNCKIESVISLDDRGQMVLPKEIRERANIRAGDKLAVISWEKEGEICCISLVKTDDFTEMLKDLLGPMMREVASK